MDFIQARPGSTCESANIDLETYCENVKHQWPAVTVEKLQRLGFAGRILWFIVAIAGDAEAIVHEDFTGHVRNLRLYAAGLNDTFRALGWPIVDRRTGKQVMACAAGIPLNATKNRRIGWGKEC